MANFGSVPGHKYTQPGQLEPGRLWIAPPSGFNPATGASWQGDAQQDRCTQRQDYDPTEQAWAVGPPLNAVQQRAWTDPQADPPPALTYDPTDQSWAIGPPQNAVQLNAWLIERDLPDQTRWWYDSQDGGIPPRPFAAPFDPSTGFPWNRDRDYPDQTAVWYQPDELAFIPEPTTENLAPLWNQGDDTADRTIKTFDPTDQAWSVGPPQNADRLTQWAMPREESGPPATVDPTDQPYAIQPPAAAAFDPANGFPWNGDERQDQTRQPVWYEPSEQAWAVQPPLNEDALSAFTVELDFPDQTVRAYDGQDGAFGRPPTFDPGTGFPWTIGDASQDASTQPVWTDNQHGALGLVPPTDQGILAGVWNLDQQQDRATGPAWFDPTDQSYAIGPTLTAAQLGALWNNADPQQDRSLQPVWYDPEFGNVWTVGAAIITVVVGGRGPDSGAAYNATPYGSAYAPVPNGSVSGPVPAGSATNPRPQR